MNENKSIVNDGNESLALGVLSSLKHDIENITMENIKEKQDELCNLGYIEAAGYLYNVADMKLECYTDSEIISYIEGIIIDVSKGMK